MFEFQQLPVEDADAKRRTLPAEDAEAKRASLSAEDKEAKRKAFAEKSGPVRLEELHEVADLNRGPNVKPIPLVRRAPLPGGGGLAGIPMTPEQLARLAKVR